MKKLKFCFFVLLFNSLTSFSQIKQTYFFFNWDKAYKKDSAHFVREINNSANSNNLFELKELYLPSKKVYSEGYCLDKKCQKKTGIQNYYHENGQLLKIEKRDNKGMLEDSSIGYFEDGKIEFIGFFKNNNMCGEWKWYHPNGVVSSKEIYDDNGILKELNFYNSNGVIIPARLNDVERIANFPGGDMALKRFLVSKIEKDNLLGASFFSDDSKILMKAVIETDGKPTNISVELGSDTILDNETLRVAKLMPNWLPAMSHNKPVRSVVTFYLEYRFLLNLNLEK